MTADLPFVDEIERVIEAPAAAVYLATTRVMARAFQGRGARVFSGFLKSEHRGTSYSVPPVVGQQANGFRVTRVDEPRALILEGRHRFATYRLSFFVDPLTESRSRLRARTDAVFPGFQGAMYRAVVISSRGHSLIVNRMLRAISLQATRSQVASL